MSQERWDTGQVVWDGIDEFSKFLRETPGVVEKDIVAALFHEGSNIMGESVRMVPVDTGNLRASGHVKLPEIKRNTVSVLLAYGTDYAVYVHEIITNSHVNGWAKFLEGPVKNHEKGFTDRMRRRVLDRIGKRGL